MATAIWNKSATRSDTEVKSAFKYIKQALSNLPNDKAIKTLYEEIKPQHDRIQDQQEESKEVKTTKEKVLSRVKIDEPVIEEVKVQAEQLHPVQQPVPQNMPM